MKLIRSNVCELVKNHCDSYLSSPNYSFPDLKNNLLNKSVITQIHSQVNLVLSAELAQDQQEIKETLETQAFQEQIRQDTNEEQQDLKQEKEDEVSRKRLESESALITQRVTALNLQLSSQTPTLIQKNILLVSISSSLSQYSAQLEQIEQQIIQARLPKPDNVHGHPANLAELRLQQEHLNKVMYPLKIQKRELDQNIETLNRQITECNNKIVNSLKRQEDISQELLENLPNKSSARHKRKEQRDNRAEARKGYKQTHLGVLSTLSSENQLKVTESIKQQHQLLQDQFNRLIQEAKNQNYLLFLERLELHLAKLILTNQECEALRVILRLMKQHLQHEQSAKNKAQDLEQTKTNLRNANSSLQSATTKLAQLKAANPELIQQNTNLTQSNSSLEPQLERNTRLRQRLITPALLVAALTFIAAVPLILTISGTIPFFIAPALLFTVVAIPPAILLLTTLSLGISGLVYATKARFNKSQIERNQQLIHSNNLTMRSNIEEISYLERTDIPSLKGNISDYEQTRDRLIKEVESEQGLSEQTLQKAQSTEPSSFAYTTLLNTQPHLLDEPFFSDVPVLGLGKSH